VTVSFNVYRPAKGNIASDRQEMEWAMSYDVCSS